MNPNPASAAPQAQFTPPAPNGVRFVARQPIFDKHQRIFAYELLSRSGWENSFRGDTSVAVRQMLDSFLVLGIDALARHTRAFINCSREALVEKLVAFLPPQTTVLEILETVEPDADVIAACRDLKKRGFQIALDDFIPREGMGGLVDVADYVKLDFRANTPDQLRGIQKELRGSKARLIAEKVETQAEFERALAEGYSHFQGYFLCRPTIFTNREIQPNRLNYMRLLSELSQPSMRMKEIERIVMSEASLCYRVLRYVNSATFGLRQEVESVRTALVLIGEEPFRKLVCSAMAVALSSDRPPHLVVTSLQRARFCELVAPYAGQHASEQYLLGLLSVVDAILEMPMQDLVAMLPLRAEANAALLGEQNRLSLPLRLLLDYEESRWEGAAALARAAGLTEQQVTGFYLDAIQFADRMSKVAVG